MKNLIANLENFKNNELKKEEDNNYPNNFQGAGTISVMDGKKVIYVISTNGALPIMEDGVKNIVDKFNLENDTHIEMVECLN